MFRVEVRSKETDIKQGVSARSGKEYRIEEQNAYLFLGDEPYPQKVRITLPDNEPAYEPGYYEVSPHSFYVGGFSQLQCRLRLDRSTRQPLREASAAKASA